MLETNLAVDPLHRVAVLLLTYIALYVLADYGRYAAAWEWVTSRPGSVFTVALIPGFLHTFPPAPMAAPVADYIAGLMLAMAGFFIIRAIKEVLSTPSTKPAQESVSRSFIEYALPRINRLAGVYLIGTLVALVAAYAITSSLGLEIGLWWAPVMISLWVIALVGFDLQLPGERTGPRDMAISGGATVLLIHALALVVPSAFLLAVVLFGLLVGMLLSLILNYRSAYRAVAE